MKIGTTTNIATSIPIDTTVEVVTSAELGPFVVEPEVLAFISRVKADGGMTISASYLNAFVLNAKDNNYFNDIVAAYSPDFGVKAGTGAAKLYSITGAAYDIAQATGSNQPTIVYDDLNHKTRLLFNGVNHRMTSAAFTFSQPETVILGGFEQESWTNNDRFFDGAVTSAGTLYQGATSPNIRAYAGLNSAENTNLAVATPAHVRCLFNGASSEIQIDNNAHTDGNVGASNMGGFTLGGAPASAFSHISIGLVVLLNSAFDAGYAAKMEAIRIFSKNAYGTP